MGVQIFWDNDEHTIIRQMYDGEIRSEDYYRAIDQVAKMIQSEPHPVHSIYHRAGIKAQPSSLVSILRYGHRVMPPNLGINVIVGASPFTRVMVNIGSAIAGNLVRNVFFADSTAEAHAIIAREAQRLTHPTQSSSDGIQRT